MDHWAARRGSGSDGSGASTRPAFGLGGGGPRCSMCPVISDISAENGALNVGSEDTDALPRSPLKDEAYDMASWKPSSSLTSPHVSKAIGLEENTNSLFQRLLESTSFPSGFNSKKFIDEFAAKLFSCSNEKAEMCKEKERMQCIGRTKVQPSKGRGRGQHSRVHSTVTTCGQGRLHGRGGVFTKRQGRK